MRCHYPGCNASKTKASLRYTSFHRIPFIDIELRKLWLAALNMDANITPEQTKNVLVCSDHFEAEDFHLKEPTLASPKKRTGLRRLVKQKKDKLERTRLKSQAVPKTSKVEVTLHILCYVSPLHRFTLLSLFYYSLFFNFKSCYQTTIFFVDFSLSVAFPLTQPHYHTHL